MAAPDPRVIAAMKARSFDSRVECLEHQAQGCVEFGDGIGGGTQGGVVVPRFGSREVRTARVSVGRWSGAGLFGGGGGSTSRSFINRFGGGCWHVRVKVCRSEGRELRSAASAVPLAPS
jgi:hypothetical protein